MLDSWRIQSPGEHCLPAAASTGFLQGPSLVTRTARNLTPHTDVRRTRKSFGSALDRRPPRPDGRPAGSASSVARQTNRRRADTTPPHHQTQSGCRAAHTEVRMCRPNCHHRTRQARRTRESRYIHVSYCCHPSRPLDYGTRTLIRPIRHVNGKYNVILVNYL